MAPNPDLTANEVPDLGPVPQRLSIELDTVRHLVAEQFTQWSGLPIKPVSKGGWDNYTFHLGDSMLVRLPSAAEYALAVDKEHRWLPELAAQLPVPIPVPLGLGKPGAGYPYCWSIYGWLAGESANLSVITDPTGFAIDLAGLLGALWKIDATGGPPPGIHNWYRGATLRTFDATTHDALADLGDHIEVELAAAAWEAGLAAQWDGFDVWFHGDLAAGNLLLTDGRLAGVIDFGTCGVGDPSCDLAVVWTMLTTSGRRLLRGQLDIDDSTWARGRGWALWKALQQMADALAKQDLSSAATAHRVVDSILDDFSTTS